MVLLTAMAIGGSCDQRLADGFPAQGRLLRETGIFRRILVTCSTAAGPPSEELGRCPRARFDSPQRIPYNGRKQVNASGNAIAYGVLLLLLLEEPAPACEA